MLYKLLCRVLSLGLLLLLGRELLENLAVPRKRHLQSIGLSFIRLAILSSRKEDDSIAFACCAAVGAAVDLGGFFEGLRFLGTRLLGS